jgi:hypothetical protein
MFIFIEVLKQWECKLRLRLQAKLPLLLAPLTYIPAGKACTPVITFYRLLNWEFSSFPRAAPRVICNIQELLSVQKLKTLSVPHRVYFAERNWSSNQVLNSIHARF